MPILGVIDSGKSGNLYSASYDSIATVSVGAGGASSITISSIPSTYTHLQVRGIARTARATFSNDGVVVRFNSDSGTNYSRHQIAGDTFSQSFDVNATANSTGPYGVAAGNGANANVFGPLVIDIFDYANTNKSKTFRYFGGVDNNSNSNQTNGWVGLSSGAWYNTNAITSITFSGLSGNLLQFSTFALYGIKVS
jgi:hypothetical protein